LRKSALYLIGKIMKKITYLAVAAALLASQGAMAACSDIDPVKLTTYAKGTTNTGGYGLPLWATVVDETGIVCYVVTSGAPGASAGNAAWLGSRVISAQKANTANDFSVDGYAISTANLYSAVQPGGSLYGLQHSNPVDPAIAYNIPDPTKLGTGATDPLVGNRVGGVNVFGGGLALYKGGKKVGALGVSGDTSCRDHANAWQIRANLGLQPTAPTVGITTYNVDAYGKLQHNLPGATAGDEIIINADTDDNSYWTGWSQPACPNSLGLTAAENKANGTLLLKHDQR
jgi:uncharacterized protein GlcG (DUF336 family)